MSVSELDTATSRRSLRARAEWLSRYAAGTTLIALLLVAAVVTPAFYSVGNLRTVALQTSVLGVVVVGQTLALLVRGLDMSVNSVVAFSGVLVVSAGKPGMVVWFLLIAVVISASVGLANGLLVTWRGVPPFIATFAMLIVVGGIRLAYTHGQTSGSVPSWLRGLGAGSAMGVPVPVLVWLGLTLTLWAALKGTHWGRWIYACGTSPEAARHAGVPVAGVMVSAYVLCSLCAMVAGLLLSGYLGYVDQNLGSTLNLNSLTAAIVGGVAFSGGRGSVWGAAIGAVLMTVLVNVVVVAGLPVYWQYIAMGVVLVLAVAVQGLRDRATPDA